MIRVVLAVLLAAALLSISLPAIDAVGEERATAQMDRAVERIEASAVDLRQENPGPTARLGPRRVIDLRLPGRSLTTAGVEYISITGREGGPARISYALSEREPSHRDLTVPIATPDGDVVLRSTGRHTILLRLVHREGDPTVVVSHRDRDGSDAPTGTSAPQSQLPTRSSVLP